MSPLTDPEQRGRALSQEFSVLGSQKQEREYDSIHKILPDFIKIVVIKDFCKLSSDLHMHMPLSKRNKRKHSMTFNN